MSKTGCYICNDPIEPGQELCPYCAEEMDDYLSGLEPDKPEFNWDETIEAEDLGYEFPEDEPGLYPGI